ncbi:MAG: hypothetical protein NXI32_18860 [bacterium]|nr:hypothetical protein [bacterium]
MSHVLDAVSFVPARLPMDIGFGLEESATSPVPGFGPELRTLIPTQGSQRQLQLGLPVMLRQMRAQHLAALWKDFCSLLRQAAIPVHCSLEELEPLPAAAVPMRFARRYNRQPLQMLDVATADLLELSLRSSAHEWGWPSELVTTNALPAFISSVRAAAGGNTPVGLELPVGADVADIELAVNSGVDFLTLHGSAFDELSVWGISRARQIANKIARASFPIVVDLPLQKIEHLPKCLAIGASVVAIDSLLKPVTDAAVAELESQTSKPAARTGKLPLSVDIRAIELRKGKSSLELLKPVESLLEGIRSILKSHMRLCAVEELAGLDKRCLRATSRRLAELSGLQMLGSLE